ncbi:MAG: hypothetical protein WCW54_03930 [Candidatus Paceibacterota bacterium]
MNKEELDLLRKAEEATDEMNKYFHKKGRSVFNRYPVVFALVVVVGATLMSQGIKGLLFEIPFLNNSPLMMFLFGILILIITGTLYKKLDK